MKDDDLPAPLVPADCDVSNSPFLLIDRHRELNWRPLTRGSAEGFVAAHTLRLRSIDQFPSGTLPDDDIDLARLADRGRDVEGWCAIKADALHGWIKCSDGRLHHPDVAEGVKNIWQARVAAARKGRAGAKKRWGRANSTAIANPMPGDSTAIANPMPGDSTAIADPMPGDSTAIADPMPGDSHYS